MNEAISIRISKGFSYHLRDIDEQASKFDVSRPEFILKAIEFFMSMDSDAWKLICAWAEAMNAPVAELVSNIFIAREARIAARIKVWGMAEPELLREFSRDERGLITGKKLFEMLFKSYVQEEESKRINQIIQDENTRPITDEERHFLINHRAGRAWLESEEYQKEQALKKTSKYDFEVNDLLRHIQSKFDISWESIYDKFIEVKDNEGPEAALKYLQEYPGAEEIK